jgi:type VI secretion system protein VasG
MIGAIVRLQLGRIERRIRDNHRVPFTYDGEVVKLIASRCTELESGGRMVDAILTNSVLPQISGEFLTRMLEGRRVSRVHVSVADGDFEYALE